MAPQDENSLALRSLLTDPQTGVDPSTGVWQVILSLAGDQPPLAGFAVNSDAYGDAPTTTALFVVGDCIGYVEATDTGGSGDPAEVAIKSAWARPLSHLRQLEVQKLKTFRRFSDRHGDVGASVVYRLTLDHDQSISIPFDGELPGNQAARDQVSAFISQLRSAWLSENLDLGGA